jgi:hypothetical protein
VADPRDPVTNPAGDHQRRRRPLTLNGRPVARRRIAVEGRTTVWNYCLLGWLTRMIGPHGAGYR